MQATAIKLLPLITGKSTNEPQVPVMMD